MRYRLIPYKHRGEIKAFVEKYDGASPSDARPFSIFNPQDAHLDITATSRKVLVERSRELERNNAYWAKFLDIHENYTVGRGIPVTPASSDPEFNKMMTKAWAEWCRNPFVDSCFSLAEGERMMARAAACDGEAFIIKVKEGAKRKLQIVECQRVGTPGPYNIAAGDIRDGIRFDAFGKPIGYFIRTKSDNNFGTFQEYGEHEVIHVFNPARFGQERGLPLCTNVINNLIDLEMLHKYEMAAAKINSEKAAIFTAKGDVLDDGDDSPWNSQGDRKSDEDPLNKIEEAYGGRVVKIENGESLNTFISQRPSVVTQEYWEFQLKKISAGIGYSDLLIFPRSVQGSVVRANLETTAARLRAEYEVYAAVVQEIYKFFAETFSYQTRVDDWWKCTTQPPRSPTVDIERNSNAIIEETRNGMRSLTANCAELGRPIEEVIREKAVECKMLKEAAVEYGITVQDLVSSMTGVFSGNLPSETFQKNKSESEKKTEKGMEENE